MQGKHYITMMNYSISIHEQSHASVDKFTFLVSTITTQLGCCVSQQVTEVSTFILYLKLYLAFPVFIVMTYNNMTSFWLWKSAEITLKILSIQQQGIITNNYKRCFLQRCRSYLRRSCL